jgi:adenylate cyclase
LRAKKSALKRLTIYRKQYERIPEFKAGLHIGKVTAVEVGDIKRDIAYLGDTLNTASRIQGICNDYEKKFLSSVSALKEYECGQKL